MCVQLYFPQTDDTPHLTPQCLVARLAATELAINLAVIHLFE